MQLSIGQGDVLVTPLQMTRFYAMVANGGKLVEPHIVKSVEEPATRASRPSFCAVPPEAAQGRRPQPGRASRRAGGPVRRDARALRDVGEHLRVVPGADRRQDGHGREVRPPAGLQGLRDQAWWCGYGPYDKPELVVCAMIENGGHGGTAAAPAALKVFEKHFNVDPASYSARIGDSD